MINKGDLRAKIKLLFNNMPPAEKTLKSQKLAENIKEFLNNLPFLKSHSIPEKFNIGAFAPLSDEVEWMFGPSEFSRQLSFPVMAKEGMHFKKSSYEDLIEKNEFGVLMKAPASAASEVTPHILLIPGRAFSTCGKRLGRGKGYYDKYLLAFSGIKVGLCFEDQIQKDIPTEDHDQLMDLIITDKQIYGDLTP